MKKVFVVMENSYDNVGVKAVFTDRSVAEEYVHTHGTWHHIEEPPINPEFPRFDKDLKAYKIQITREGDAFYAEVKDTPLIDMEECEKKVFLGQSSSPIGIHYMTTFVMAKSKEEATRVADERRLRLLDSDRWPTDHGDEQRKVVL